MLITTTNPASGFAARPSIKVDVAAENASLATEDRIDFSDPQEWIPLAGYAIAGALPLVGTIGNGVEAVNPENSKTERWVAVAATAASVVGVPTLIFGIGAGSPSGIAAGAALTTLAAGNMVHRGVKNRKSGYLPF
jgi:hypothetical protein